MSNSIQFITKESVLQAFDDRDVKAWSITQGRQFMFKGYEAIELIQVLDMLEAGATNAVYTLRVYEDLDTKKKIKSNTPDDGSFNFRLNAPEMLIRNEQYGSIAKTNEILDKLKTLEERLNEQDEEETTQNSLGRLGEILQHPAISPLVQPALEKLIAFLIPGGAPRPNLIAGIGSDNQELNGNLATIVNELKQHDPNLEQHLYKLLELAKTNPAQFNQILNFFN